MYVCVVGELACIGTKLVISDMLQGIAIPIVSFRLSINRSFFREARSHWQQKCTCNIDRLLWPSVAKKNTDSLLFINYMTIYSDAHKSIFENHALRHCYSSN